MGMGELVLSTLKKLLGCKELLPTLNGIKRVGSNFQMSPITAIATVTNLSSSYIKLKLE